MGRTAIMGAMFAVGLVFIAAVMFLTPGNRDTGASSAAFSVPGLPDMTVQAAHGAFHRLTPALLLEVHGALGQDAIREALAAVSDANALNTLDEARSGPLASGGLEDPGHILHEINLISSTVQRDGPALAIAAAWQVVGTVERTEHMHVRGNTYSADLTVAPVDGAWKITEFALTDVNSDAAGETYLVPEEG